MLRRSNSLPLLVIAYFVSAFVLAAMAGAFNDWKKSYLLTKEGHTTSGWITAKEPANHQALRYQYNVENQTYRGVQVRGQVKPGVRFEDIRIGEQVQVVFVPAQPNISCACDPAAVLRSDIVFIVVIVLLGPLGIIALSFLTKRRNSRRNEQAA